MKINKLFPQNKKENIPKKCNNDLDKRRPNTCTTVEYNENQRGVKQPKQKKAKLFPQKTKKKILHIDFISNHVEINQTLVNIRSKSCITHSRSFVKKI